MMAQHLQMVLAALLDMDGDDHLEPKSPLAKNVALHQHGSFAIWPISPHLA